MENKITLGQEVPDFQFDSTAGSQRRLSDLKGQRVVIYFYPKDHTPGCTCEAENFRDLYTEFQRQGVIVLGVSRDNLNSHAQFAENLKLPFELISDKDEKLCQLFDVIKPKTMYGKPVRSIERSTFLIDENGILQREWRGVSVPDHVQNILNEL